MLEFDLTIANMIETTGSALATIIETIESTLAIIRYLAHNT